MELEERLALINKPPIEEIFNFDIVNKPPIDELYHYGILGMHWGIRRYQNPDGTLTEEGKKHYAKKEEKALKKEAKKREEILKDPEKLSRNLDKFTEDEIKEAYRKFEWQEKISKYNNKEGAIKKGKKMVSEMISTADTANEMIKFLNTPAGKMLRSKLGLDTKNIGEFKSNEDLKKEQRDAAKAAADYNKVILENQKSAINIAKEDAELREKYRDMGNPIAFDDDEWEKFRKNNYRFK